MDAYLSKEAYHFLSGLQHLSPDITRDGLLIGHKIGHRFIIEKIFPTQKGFFSSLENYIAVDKHFEGKLVGFYTFQPAEKKMKKILKPFAFGQLFLEVRTTQKKKMEIKSYLIEYEKGFFLIPVELTLPRP